MHSEYLSLLLAYKHFGSTFPSNYLRIRAAVNDYASRGVASSTLKESLHISQRSLLYAHLKIMTFVSFQWKYKHLSTGKTVATHVPVSVCVLAKMLPIAFFFVGVWVCCNLGGGARKKIREKGEGGKGRPITGVSGILLSRLCATLPYIAKMGKENNNAVWNYYQELFNTL